ncbi:MAG: hypothetical protein JW894_16130 [Bacteroidales bacterium]|nr:hypothetical protein [Bacteroidales bacterium]
MRRNIWRLEEKITYNGTYCVESIVKKLSQKVGKFNSNISILSISIFLSHDQDEFYEVRKKIIIRIKDEFPETPALSVIAQKTTGGDGILLEANVIYNYTSDIAVSYESINDEIFYTKVKAVDFDEYYFSGLTYNGTELSMETRIEKAHSILKNAFRKEGIGMYDIVRQWNYVEAITGSDKTKEDPVQNYQVLNNIRHTYYSAYEFSGGYPAATGIGMHTGGFILDCLALKRKTEKLVIKLVKNPLQLSAYEYSQDVLNGSSSGVTVWHTPKFERAKIVQWAQGSYSVLISGTAAIHNEKSLALGDAAEQTRITLDNIDKLIESASNMIKVDQGKSVNRVIKYLRVYIRNKNDVDIVSSICNAYWKDTEPVYLIADICRAELLVEIEGIVDLIPI